MGVPSWQTPMRSKYGLFYNLIVVIIVRIGKGYAKTGFFGHDRWGMFMACTRLGPLKAGSEKYEKNIMGIFGNFWG